MNDQRKTKKQVLEALQRERERLIALQEVSTKIAAACNTNGELNLIANKAARLLEEENLVIRASTDSVAGYLADTSAVMPEERTIDAGHVMATKKTTVDGGMP